MNAQAQDDGGWVAAAQGGDREAFARIMERYRRPVLDFCFRMTGRPDDAAELAQDTFVKAWKALGCYRPRPGAAFSTWVFQIARNRCLDYRRRSRRDPLFHAEDADAASAVAAGVSVEADVHARETGARIAAAVASLPEDQRTAMVLAEYEGLSHDDIAAAMGVSVKSVESRLYRARHALRRALKDLLPSTPD